MSPRKKALTQWQVFRAAVVYLAAVALVSWVVAGCIRIRYLSPEGEQSYRELYEACREAHTECEQDMSECLDHLENLGKCP